MIEVAQDYLRRGWAPLPVPFASKAPVLKDWPNLRLTEDVLPDYFTGRRQNIGVILGAASAGLADVDCDSREAVRLAPRFLPATRTFGRTRKPRSHWLFVADPPLEQTEKFQDPTAPEGEGAMLVELRSTGGQTVFPPSTHESGEPITWDNDREPVAMEAGELRARVARLASAALLVRHWPATGGRQDAALALAGGLLRAGWEAGPVAEFVLGVADAAGDEEAAKRGAAAADTAARQATGKETTGWPNLARLLNGAVVDRVREWLGLREAEPATPREEKPSVCGPSWPEAPDPAALHGLAGDVVRAVEPHTEADPVALLGQFLVAFGNVVGRGPHFVAEADRHYPNLFAGLVGTTAKGRKGSSLGQVRRLFETLEPAWAKDRILSGLSSGEGLIWAVRDPIEKQVPIKEKGRVVDYQTVIEDHGVDDKRLLVVEEELGSTLRVMARDGSTLSATIRCAWNTGDLQTLTKNSPARATGAHISIIGHITRDELLRYLDSTETANGFANRFLWLCVRRSKVLPEGGRFHEVDAGPLVRRLRQALEFARTAGEMRRDEAAREVWHAVYPALSEAKPGLLGAAVARGEAQVMRLACLYALLDCSAVIREEHLLAALALWEYAEASARFVFGDSLGDPVADQILRALRGAADGMTRTDISHHFGRNVSSGRLGRALELLLENHLAERTQEPTGGRPEERWRAVAR